MTNPLKGVCVPPGCRTRWVAWLGCGWWNNSRRTPHERCPGFMPWLNMPDVGDGFPSGLVGTLIEPDVAGVTPYISPADAATLWALYVDRFPGCEFLAPTLSSLAGTAWLVAWMGAVERIYHGPPPRLAGFSWNLYVPLTTALQFSRDVMDLAGRWPGPFVHIIKECRFDAIPDARQAITWFESHGVRYAWFPTRKIAGNPANSAPLTMLDLWPTPYGTMYRAAR